MKRTHSAKFWVLLSAFAVAMLIFYLAPMQRLFEGTSETEVSPTTSPQSSDSLIDTIEWPVRPDFANGRARWPVIEVPALPGILEFEVMAYNPRNGQPGHAVQLAKETRNPAWATEQESRIHERLAAVEPNVDSLDVECRATICGLLFVLSESSFEQESFIDDVTDALGEELGFNGRFSYPSQTVELVPFVAVYLFQYPRPDWPY